MSDDVRLCRTCAHALAESDALARLLRSDPLIGPDLPGWLSDAIARKVIDLGYGRALPPGVVRDPLATKPGAETYGGTVDTCGVLHSHVIPCQVAHPTRHDAEETT